MGFYPVNPASSIYVIGCPILKETSIELKDGKIFKVIAKNISDKNIYIQSAKLNGKNYNKTFIHQSDIDNGGVLEFVMGSKPNKKWGIGLEDRPIK
jgi:putative alpha-1,2-mannosidase